jgi:hypothetical protein
MLLLALMLNAPSAYAQEDDEDEIDFSEEAIDPDDFEDADWGDDEDEDEDVERLDAGDDDLDDFEGEDLDDDEWIDDIEGEGEDLEFDDELEDMDDDEIGGEGVDNVAIYRDYIDNMDDLPLEEEIIAWERYLEKYPNTLFRDRINARMDEITSELYGERIEDGNEGYVDAKDREIEFAHPVQLENIDPRSRLRVAVELGFPNWAGGQLDFEYQVLRPLSLHAGVKKRYTGGNVEVGAKYAIIKSARTNLLVTGLLDARLNLAPGYIGLRPQIAAGKRFEVGNGLDVMVIGGVDIGTQDIGGIGIAGNTRYIGGFHAYYRASDVVGVFAEGSINMKGSGADDIGNFSFNVVTFGLKFIPRAAPVHVGLNANVPAQYNYWGYHFGAVQADANFYLDEYL